MSKISCLIVEDEPNAVQLLQVYTARIPELHLAGVCYDALEALDFFKTKEVDLLFLDINMPELSGIDLAGLLPKDQKIIFTTAYTEYALESFHYFVVDYLLKPITFKRFIQAVNKVIAIAPHLESITTKSESILIKSGREIIKLNTDDIVLIESMKEYVCIYTATEKVMVYKRMKEMEQALPSSLFLRVHRSYIVNMKQITKKENNELTIRNITIPISLSYKERVMQYLQSQLI